MKLLNDLSSFPKLPRKYSHQNLLKLLKSTFTHIMRCYTQVLKLLKFKIKITDSKAKPMQVIPIKYKAL